MDYFLINLCIIYEYIFILYMVLNEHFYAHSFLFPFSDIFRIVSKKWDC